MHKINAELLLKSNDTLMMRFPLHNKILRVGKNAGNDISLPEQNIAPWLCSFERISHQQFVIQARNQDGVLVNNILVHKKDLHNGDTIEMGNYKAVFSTIENNTNSPTSKDRTKVQTTGILRPNKLGELQHQELHLLHQESGDILEIPPQGLRIGAHQDNDKCIDDGFVSSYHAQIFLKGEKLFVIDLDSTNGTFVSGVRVIEAEVPIGSIITMGHNNFKVGSSNTSEILPNINESGPWQCGEMHSNNLEMAKLFEKIKKVARHDASICILGETGTGKELVAKALHTFSARAEHPFVAINCASIPASLTESTLFGHEKGSFTGAAALHKGVFEEAHMGTLFLDEIGEFPLDLQAKLLRTLETRTVRRIGGRHDIPVNIRIVCATHRDLMQSVNNGDFREDLLHRLYVFPLQIPPLRDRHDDIAFLAQHFLNMMSFGRIKLDQTGLEKLKQHSFTGNIRELRNLMQRALILDEDQIISAEDIVFISNPLDNSVTELQLKTPEVSRDQIEKNTLQEALDAYQNSADAAEALGMSKSTFWRRCKAHNLIKHQRKRKVKN